MKGSSKGKTTFAGYVNRNEQKNLGRTEPKRAGTDHCQYVYILRCLKCRRDYGANGSDIWLRKCPFCLGGQPGLDLLPHELEMR